MPISEVARTVLRAREAVLAAPTATDQTSGVRPQILDSWRRSIHYGLEPDRCVPRPVAAVGSATTLADKAGMVVAARDSALSQSECSLAITDADGRLIRRWAPDRRFAALLDEHCIVPDVSVAESATGTGSSSIVLETGRPVTVAGPEHFNEAWIDLTCAGAPIRDPMTRRLVGSLNLTVPYADTSPFLQSWVSALAAEVEESLMTDASADERLLLSAYMRANRGTRQPIVCLNEQTVISNSMATRMLSPVDQVTLWEVTSQMLRSSDAAVSVTLADGSLVSVSVAPVSDGSKPIGAVIALKRLDESALQSVSAHPSMHTGGLPGLVGSSAAWRRLCSSAIAAADAPALVVGEPGSGKMAVASAMGGGDTPEVIDAGLAARGQSEWLDGLRIACESGAPVVVIRHVERLDPSLATPTIEVLRDAQQSGVIVRATLTTDPASGEVHTGLIDWFEHIVEVPALSQRIDDMALLLAELTRRDGSGTGARWTPAAIQTMTRIHWPRNVASLEEAVRITLMTTKKLNIDVADLSSDLRTRATRRTLVGLEQVEAKAILDAMRSAGGNKSIAADSLGIARSTLYRKVRALGIDLDADGY